MTSTEVRSSNYLPPIPRNSDELGIQMTLVADLLLRRVQMDGTSSLQGLVEALKLSHGIVETVFKHLRQQKLLDVRGMIGEDYLFGLTSAGQKLANDRKKACRYAGPAPISVQEYQRSVRAQAAKVRLNRAILAEALGDLVMAEDLLQQLGPALVSQKSLFLYGPTGNGKTSVAERLQRIYHDFVFLPYAIEVDGQIIVIYDPVVHERVEIEEQHDPRFVPCRRPFIVVGGELTPAMLELRLDPVSQIYSAPLQMKANNGILVIDDFGRQMISPRKLLNRWIVPLDRRVDYLTLGYGVKFQIPFELMVIFSTNLDPLQLADEAFLRRIHNKVYVGAVDAAVFDEIFDRVLQERAVAAPANAAALVRELLYRSGCSELRACYPADICMIAQWITTFEERRSEFTELDLERAVALYFTRRGLDQQTVPSYE